MECDQVSLGHWTSINTVKFRLQRVSVRMYPLSSKLTLYNYASPHFRRQDTTLNVELSIEGVEVRISDQIGIHIGSDKPEQVKVFCKGQVYTHVRTYTVINKLQQELVANGWYFDVVMRGAITCGLTEEYCWRLFEHMYRLQKYQFQPNLQLESKYY